MKVTWDDYNESDSNVSEEDLGNYLAFIFSIVSSNSASDIDDDIYECDEDNSNIQEA